MPGRLQTLPALQTGVTGREDTPALLRIDGMDRTRVRVEIEAVEESITYRQPVRMYQNSGDGTFIALEGTFIGEDGTSAFVSRGAAYGDRAAVLRTVREQIADHVTRLEHYEQLAARDFPDPTSLSGHALDVYLVLRGGIRLERFWVDWLTEYLHAHESPARRTTEGRSR